VPDAVAVVALEPIEIRLIPALSRLYRGRVGSSETVRRDDPAGRGRVFRKKVLGSDRSTF
jgi:hypothetical protein